KHSRITKAVLEVICNLNYLERRCPDKQALPSLTGRWFPIASLFMVPTSCTTRGEHWEITSPFSYAVKMQLIGRSSSENWEPAKHGQLPPMRMAINLLR